MNDAPCQGFKCITHMHNFKYVHNYVMHMRKVRTTINLSKDLVEKAKELNINVSETAERILESLTVEEESEKVLKDKEIDFLKFLLPILEKKKISVEIGFLEDQLKIHWKPKTPEEAKETEPYHHYVSLTPNGKFWVDTYEQAYKFQDIMDKPNFYIYTPAEIFNNLVKELEKKKEWDKKRTEEFETVKKIVLAIMPDDRSKRLKEGGAKKS